MNFIHWQRYPFVRLLPAFILGIYLGSRFSGIPVLGLFTIIFGGFSLLFISKLSRKFKSIVLHVLLLFTGIILSVSHDDQPPLLPIAAQACIGTVLADMEEKNKTYKTTVKLQYQDRDQQSTNTKAIVYIQKSDIAKELQIGDKIVLNSKFKPVQKPSLPGEFDYSKHLASKGIYLTAFVKTSDWIKTKDIDKSLLINRIASNKRNHFSEIIEKHVSPSTQPLVKAISIGQRTELESETTASFSKAGIMHILAVSGLHVGIIWSIISFLLAPILKWKPSLKFITFLVEVSCIWMFAFITGFAPSVQRAAFMFTILAISKLNKYEKESVNLIIASAVMLLVFNPKLLFSVGFQLSYSAVLGIVFLYPKIYPLIFCRNKFLDAIWKVQVVSIAAVIGTAPLSIFYFNQFSLIFPVTNLIAIPAAYVLVIGSVCLFAFGAIEVVANLIGNILSLIGSFLMNTIEWIAQFSFSSLTALYINEVELTLIILILFTVGVLIYQFQYAKRLLIISLVLINILFVYRGNRKLVTYQNTEYFELKNNTQQLISVGKKLYIIDNKDKKFNQRNPSNGFFSNQLIYKNEKLTTSEINISYLLPNHQDKYATIESVK